MSKFFFSLNVLFFLKQHKLKYDRFVVIEGDEKRIEFKMFRHVRSLVS
jgi:hypothetical protein